MDQGVLIKKYEKEIRDLR